MILSASDVLGYLANVDLMERAAIFDGDVRVFDVSRRNRNYRVVSEQTSYLIKQGTGGDTRATVAHEAAVYRHIAKSTLEQRVPRFFFFDPSDAILVLEWLPHAEALNEYHSRTSRFPPTLLANLGDTLAQLHSLPAVDDFQVPPLWVLAVNRPPVSMIREVSSASLMLIKIVQGHRELSEGLDELQVEWQSGPKALIHFDLRLENCVLTRAWIPSPEGRLLKAPTVRVIDWEVAGIGDPAWDVGAVFASYLSLWLWSVPVGGATAPDQFLDLARYPLTTIQPALRAFWGAYVVRSGLDAVAADRALLRAVRYAAAALVRNGFEALQNAIEISAQIVCMLQVAANIMKSPQEAAVHLLGIPARLPVLA